MFLFDVGVGFLFVKFIIAWAPVNIISNLCLWVATLACIVSVQQTHNTAKCALWIIHLTLLCLILKRIFILSNFQVWILSSESQRIFIIF